jgi:recombinational DNA repair protein RecT
MTFGVKSSPYECEATIHELARSCEEDFSKAAQEVQENMYMDDYVGGEDTPQEAIKLQRDMTEMMKRGGFKLTKWASNSDEVMRQIPEEEKDPRLIVDFDSKEGEVSRPNATLKTLGVA